MADIRSVIDEFVLALNEEIAALKKGKGGTNVRVFNGQLVKQLPGMYIYRFHLENFLVAMDDTPGEIIVNGRRLNCQVITVQGLEVEVSIDQHLGQSISEAILQTNLWFLLELLAKKLTENKNGLSNSTLAANMMTGLAREIGCDSTIAYSNSAWPLNEKQKEAIVASYSRSLAIIWGPPGTGKTATIAKAAEAHLNAGRRVLIVSHANTAVDQALKKVAEQLRDTPHYNEGKIIRLGAPRLDGLTEQYPLVMLDKVAEMKGAFLAAEKERLIAEVKEHTSKLQAFEEPLSTSNQLAATRKELAAAEGGLTAANRAYQKARKARAALDSQLESERDRLNQARSSGAIRRFLLGLDPDRIQQVITSLKKTISLQEKEKDALEKKATSLEADVARLQDTVVSLGANLDELLRLLGMTLDAVSEKVNQIRSLIDELDLKVKAIDAQLASLEEKILTEASLVATTLTKTFSSRQFPSHPFDVVIVDEASMAPLPQLYWAVSRGKLATTIVGDFLQLAPICVSDSDMAKKWLKRSLFDVLDITQPEVAAVDNRVSLLDTQYRMAPAIARISNEYFYDELLKDANLTRCVEVPETMGSKEALILIDTSDLNPWASKLTSGGRFNVYNALVVATVAERVLEGLGHEAHIGVVAPYRAQARLIGKILDDRKLLEQVRVNTVHSFQGGEEAAIIFDCVEGHGVSTWSMLDSVRAGQDACKLINVAITRAIAKLVLVGNVCYLAQTLRGNSVLNSIIRDFQARGEVFMADDVVDSYIDADFSFWMERLSNGYYDLVGERTGFYNQASFWPAFLADINEVSESLLIMSPFIGRSRAGALYNLFSVLRSRGVEIKVFTKPPKEQMGDLGEAAQEMINALSAIGVNVTQRPKMHQKVAIIDGDVLWAGSLNILSHNNTEEQMIRYTGFEACREIMRTMDLDKELAPGNLTEELCPLCGAALVVRHGRYGDFLSCSEYPKCKYSRSLPR